MKPPFIKICGIQNYAEAKLALDCGATALGFLVGLTHLAEDKIDEYTARDIVAKLPDHTNTVMVTHLLDIVKIAELAEYMNVKTIQLHDDVSAASARQLHSVAVDKILLKAVHIIDGTAIDYAKAYQAAVEGLILDSRTADRLGGTGQPHDWSISRTIVEQSLLPVYLAGGLNPQNIEQAIRQVHPDGVDVNSGVENAEGRKDPVKIKRFIDSALKAFKLYN